jgi:hypothetical protein
MRKVRCSSLPYLMVCTPSVIHPDGFLPVEGENETALLGTLVHALCESVVATGEYDVKPLRQQLSDNDYARAMMLFNNFIDVWTEARKFILEPEVETYHEADIGGGIAITGHMDVHQRYSDRAYVIDYKTGRQHENHYHQMAGYAFLCWDMAGRPQKYVVYVTAVYLEDKTTQGYEFSPDSLNQWAAGVVAKVADTRFVVGRKCSFCGIQGSCPAYRVYVGGAIAALTDRPYDRPVWEELAPEQRGALADSMYVVEKAIDRAKFGLRHAVRAAGSLDLGGGNQYELVEQSERGVDADKARAVLAKLVPEWHSHARFRLDDLLTAYAKQAPRGEKGKYKKALLDKLADAGAIITAKSTKMYRRPKAETKMTEA